MASTALHAQDTAKPPAAATPSAPAPPAPRLDIRGPDGKPLPPEIQREIEEQIRKNPPAVRPAGTPGGGGSGDIVVTGQRPRGSVVGDIPPERTFGPLDIRAYGAGTIQELVDTLGSQVGSNRGRGDAGPVTLLNGRRISSIAEIARIPPEAIERMEVFPEELALKYGYRADQKVVNIVTLERYQARVGQLAYSRPTEGGRDTLAPTADLLMIRGDTRYGLGAAYTRSGALLERDREVLQPAGMSDLGRLRTLLPETERFALNGLVGGNPLAGVSSSVNARFEASDARSLLGPGSDGALTREVDTRTIHLGTTHGGRAGQWLWTATGNYDRIDTDILTDTVAGPRDLARSVNTLADADLVLSGAVLDLPAGPLAASVRGGVSMRDFLGRTFRDGVERRDELSRDRAAIQLNLDLPITRPASPVGAFSANANLEAERLSDVGTLRTIGYGLVWTPAPAINVIASATHEEGAPTVEQLGGPLVVTPNVRTYDFLRGEVIDITRVFGGNAALRSDDRHLVRFGLTARPVRGRDLTLSLDYVATRIDRPIAAFPILTPPIEAAFPDRFARDGDGRLLGIDGRPLNFVRSDARQLRLGVNLVRPLGAVPPELRNAPARIVSSEAEARRRMPNAVFITAEPGSALARRGENLRSRLFVTLYHNWRLEDAILLREGLPVLDLLDGGAIDFRGGRPRHQIELQAGAFKRGLGLRLDIDWQSGTTVRGLGGGAGDLRFSDLATVNLNLFANLNERFGGSTAPAWLRGARATVGITNLFNTRLRVRDDTGATPLSYQPAYLDPLGRTVSVSLRKLF